MVIYKYVSRFHENYKPKIENFYWLVAHILSLFPVIFTSNPLQMVNMHILRVNDVDGEFR